MQKTSVDIIKILKKAGHKAYWAGGCVRDYLLGQDPQDYDIVTSAKPEEIEDLLEHTIPIGKEYGVIIAIVNGHHFEIATFRSDSGYSDGRRPDAIEYTDPEQDALRRDFTINGLFYDPLKDKIYDFVDGQKDLKNRLIRFIGDPKLRIQEDHLRILRAIRFKNTLNFMYHPGTYDALVENSNLAGNVSQERARDELNKMLLHKNRVQALRDMSETDVLKDILPELEEMKGVAQPYEMHMEGDVFEHTMRSVDALNPESSLELIWAVLLHDVGKPDTFAIKERIRFDNHCERSEEIAGNILRRLKSPTKQIKQIKWLIVHHFIMVQLLEMPEARKLHWFRHEGFTDLLELFRCDATGQIPIDLSLYEDVRDAYQKGMAKMPKEIKKLISGKDIMEITGIKAGKEVGDILHQVYELQLEKKITTKAQAVKWVKGKFVK
ncbi:CCA tRNA nucleotidyltransferase [Patescibacteria group bacterium]|nr:CCA tRNA nucleotidyltransferase [Patescibacteria group bacterium]